MKCTKCGKEFSKNVCRIHAKNCKGNLEQVEKLDKIDYSTLSFNELRKLAKEHELDLGKTPKKADIIKALEGVDND